jgi:homoserine O-acetyltransferase
MKCIGTHLYEDLQPFKVESGESLPGLTLAYQTWGTLNADKTNVILICHALTGHANAEEWFSGLFDKSGILHDSSNFVICINVPGSCYGSSGPISKNPVTNELYRDKFPVFTIRDLVRAQQRLLDHLKINEIKLVIGGSMGGMQALEFVLMDERVKAAAILAAGARHEAWAIGISEAQRQAIYADGKWNNGAYSLEHPPSKGLSAARMMAMVTYRTHPQYNHRFDRETRSDGVLQVASYLNYQGKKLAGRFDPLSYIRLTQSMDTHDVGRGRGGVESALAKCNKPVLVVGIDSDLLYPTEEQKKLAQLFPNGVYREISSPYGHDAFLIEFEALNELLHKFQEEHIHPLKTTS